MVFSEVIGVGMEKRQHQRARVVMANDTVGAAAAAGGLVLAHTYGEGGNASRFGFGDLGLIGAVHMP